MPSKPSTSRDDWHKSFYAGATLSVWRQAMGEDVTADEFEFLQSVFELEAGASLLDLPCGNGRLSQAFALAGYNVTGVEYSPEYVEEAKANAKTAKIGSKAGSASDGSLNYVQGDMRDIKFDGEFDGAFCMGNSFGYFDRVGTVAFFKTVAAALKPGGKFVLDSLMVAESFLVNGGEREWVPVGETYMLVENKYDPMTSSVQSEYTYVDGNGGKVEKRQSMTYIYSTGEVVRMLAEAGMETLELFSNTECEPFELGADRLLLVAVKS